VIKIKIKSDFFENCPVILDDTNYNISKGINMKFGLVKYHESTLGVLVKLESGGWAYYFANDIQVGIVG
jgi:hypothetical protein